METTRESKAGKTSTLIGWMVSGPFLVSCICEVDVMLEKQLWKLRADQTKEEREII